MVDGFILNLEATPTAYAISGLVAIAMYKKLPTID